MAKSLSVRVETVTRSGYAGQRMHDNREKDLNYVDSSRSKFNTEPMAAPDTSAMTAECMARRYERYERGELQREPRSIRQDGIIGVRGMITFSADAQPDIEALEVTDQDNRFFNAATRVADRLGTTLAGLVVHRDESAIHAHFFLHGYGINGLPVSKQMTIPAYKSLQDLAAEAYADLGIQRGKPKAARMADGEDPSKYINRSVRELHRDLPAEIAAVRAERDQARLEAGQAQAELESLREKLGDTQRRLEATNAKLLEAEQAAETTERAMEKLRQRAANYKARADRQEAKIKELERQVKLPAPTVIDRVVSAGTWPKQPKIAATPVYSPKAVEKSMRRAYAQRDEAKDAAERESQRRDEIIEQQTMALEPWAVATPGPGLIEIEDVRGPFAQWYGVSLSVRPDRVVAPPQNVTPRQIAAALYRAGREAGWDKLWFDVNSEVAAEVVRMAADDGRLDQIRFTRPSEHKLQNAMIEDVRAERAEGVGKSPEPDQQGASTGEKGRRSGSRKGPSRDRDMSP